MLGPPRNFVLARILKHKQVSQTTRRNGISLHFRKLSSSLLVCRMARKGPLRIRQWLLLFCNYLRFWCHFCIHFSVVLPLRRDIVFMKNSLNGALRDASLTVNAFLWVDVEHLFPFVEAFDWANDDTIRISASNAGLSNNVGHGLKPFFRSQYSLKLSMKRSQGGRKNYHLILAWNTITSVSRYENEDHKIP